VAKDINRTIELDRKACDNQGVQGCTTLAFIYATGAGVPKDSAEASKYSRKGCDGGNLSACISLAVAYYTGRGVPKDTGQAVALDTQACVGGETWACMSLAATEFMVQQGLGDEKDDAPPGEREPEDLRQRADDGVRHVGASAAQRVGSRAGTKMRRWCCSTRRATAAQ